MRACLCTKRDAIVAVCCVAMLLLVVGAASQSQRERMFRQSCANNLSSLGKTMLVYGADYGDQLPKAGLRRNEWVPTLPNWAAPRRWDAYGIMYDGSSRAGKVTVTSSLYLLVKYAEVKVETFICPGEAATTPLNLRQVSEELPRRFELIDAWDFGGRYDAKNNPSTHCSYAYHMPFGRHSLTMAHPLGMPVMADRNPWMDPNRVADPNTGWARFDPSVSDSNEARIGNSDAHGREGQNVLFLDGHVRFHRRPTCGLDGDNIYSIASDTTEMGRAKGCRPQVYDPAQPLNRRDSMLVQEAAYDVPTPAPESAEPGR